MARIALINIGMHGHVNPTLGFTEELVARGHEVDFYATPEFADAIGRTGAQFIAYPTTLGQSAAEFAAAKAGATSRGEPPPPAPSTMARVISELSSTLPFLMRDLSARRPDLIIYDFASAGGFAVARHLGIKAIKFCTTYASNEHYNLLRETFAKHDFPTPEQIAQAQTMIDTICQRCHCTPLPLAATMTHIEADNLVFMPRLFQPFGETFDERFHFVGPAIRSSDPAQALALMPPGDGPLLVVSLGSLFHGWTGFYHHCIKAFGGSHWRVVMSVGAGTEVASLGQLPENITVTAHIPQVALLEMADLFISHGGMNSTMEALFFGVPLVVIPQIEEQELTARRVADLRLGRYLNWQEVTAEVLATAVAEVAGSEEIAANVAAICNDMQATGGAVRICELVEARLKAGGKKPASAERSGELSG